MPGAVFFFFVDGQGVRVPSVRAKMETPRTRVFFRALRVRSDRKAPPRYVCARLARRYAIAPVSAWACGCGATCAWRCVRFALRFPLVRSPEGPFGFIAPPLHSAAYRAGLEACGHGRVQSAPDVLATRGRRRWGGLARVRRKSYGWTPVSSPVPLATCSRAVVYCGECCEAPRGRLQQHQQAVRGHLSQPSYLRHCVAEPSVLSSTRGST